MLGLEQLLTGESCPASSLPGAAGGRSRAPAGLSRGVGEHVSAKRGLLRAAGLTWTTREELPSEGEG